MSKEENDKKVYKDSFFNDNTKYIIFWLMCIGVFVFLDYIVFYSNAAGKYDGVVYKDILYTYRLILIVLMITIVIIGIITFLIIIANTSYRKFYSDDEKLTTLFLGKEEDEIHYSAINEVYTFRRVDRRIQFPYGSINCLAFRKNSKKNWTIVKYSLRSGKEKDAGLKLIDEIIEKNISYRLSYIRNELFKGKVFKFEYLSGMNNEKRDKFDKLLYFLGNTLLDNKKKNEIANYYNNANHDFIILEKDGLIFRDSKISFEANDKIILNKHPVTWFVGTKKKYPIGYIMKILDSNNNIKVEIDLVSLINGQLFLYVVKSFYEEMGNTNTTVEKNFLDDLELDSRDIQLMKRLDKSLFINKEIVDSSNLIKINEPIEMQIIPFEETEIIKQESITEEDDNDSKLDEELLQDEGVNNSIENEEGLEESEEITEENKEEVLEESEEITKENKEEILEEGEEITKENKEEVLEEGEEITEEDENKEE